MFTDLFCFCVCLLYFFSSLYMTSERKISNAFKLIYTHDLIQNPEDTKKIFTNDHYFLSNLTYYEMIIFYSAANFLLIKFRYKTPKGAWVLDNKKFKKVFSSFVNVLIFCDTHGFNL